MSALVATRLGSQGFGVPTPASRSTVRLGIDDAAHGAPDVIPNRERLPLIRYLASCTPESSRVLVSGFGPEIPVLARRPFADGLPSWIPDTARIRATSSGPRRNSRASPCRWP